MRLIEINSPSDKSLPKWRRTLGVTDDGRVFMPAAVAGNEEKVALCASYDGVTAVLIHEHVFLPTDWLAREYPRIADICANAESKARHANDA